MRHYVLQSVSVLDPNYVSLMIARVARLSTAGADMAYPADADLVGRHSFLNDLTSYALSRAGFYQGTGRSITLRRNTLCWPDTYFMTTWEKCHLG